jgi:hypothetical protein
MRGARLCCLLAATLLVCACGASSNSTSPTSVAAPLTQSVSPVPSTLLEPGSESDGGNGQQAAVDAALSDAAAHLGVGRDVLRVTQVEPHQWPDASLGCPRPGILYSQVVTPGYLVIVNGSDKQLEYHTDARARVVLCRES